MIRLRELRKDKKLSQQAVADMLGVTQATLSGWENEKYEIDNQSLSKLASFFEVTIDYLLGRTDKKTPAPEIRDGKGKNLVRTIGRDGSYSERWLTDEQLEALQAIINQMPDVKDDF